MIGDGRVEEEEKNDDGSADSTGSFGFVTTIKAFQKRRLTTPRKKGRRR